MLAFPQAVQPTLSHLGPQWNAARSTHHRIAWLARESSKPGRDPIERWTVQASAAWSQEHLRDDAARVEAKLLQGLRRSHRHPRRALARAGAPLAPRRRPQAPLGKPHLWDAQGAHRRLPATGAWATGSKTLSSRA